MLHFSMCHTNVRESQYTYRDRTTEQEVILENVLFLFINKAIHFLMTLPLSVKGTIADDASVGY